MTREKEDPEKRNLLNEPREEKKRKQYSGSRIKTERRSCDSSSSEHRKRGSSFKMSSTEQRADFNNNVSTPSMNFRTEKNDSWWCWQNTPTKKTEDTCSCVSCALKKIVSSEYACIGCLLLLFTISIIVAFLVVFKNVPNIGGECKVMKCKDCEESATRAGPTTPRSEDPEGVADSERLKRKIEMLNNKRLKTGFIGVNEFQKNDGKGYNDVLSGRIGIPGIAGIDFGPSFHELNSVEEAEHKQSSDNDLSKILDADNIDIQNSEKLRDFYKKLTETDAKIKSLKRINQYDSYIEDVDQKSPERARRSLKLYHYPKRYSFLRRRRSIHGKQQMVNATSVAKSKPDHKTKLKRFNNEADEPSGFIIEKKKLLVQYKPNNKRRLPVKKCQHTPAGTHTHEKQMMHPFYKNSQRLDILLDKFLSKNLPEIMSDPFGVEELFKNEKLNKPCKHPKPHKNINIVDDEHFTDQIPKPKYKIKKFKYNKIVGTSSTTPFYFKMLRPESTTQYDREFFNHEAKMIEKQKKIVTTSPNDFDVLLSVSTIMNPESLKMSQTPLRHESTVLSILDRVPNLRRLMQLEAGEDEENLGYEDFKEVLADNMDNHDEAEKPKDRKRRDDFQPEPPQFPKANPPQTVHNPNWKGAMPLYPDEINSMLATKMDMPKPTQELQDLFTVQRKSRDLSDVEYVEDYLSNKYNRLVQQAQAYSDYGVLDGKKESRNEKESPTADSATNHKIKLLADENFNRVEPLVRHKRGIVPRVVKREADFRKPAAYLNEIEVTTPGSPAQTWTGINFVNEPNLHPPSEGIRIEMVPTPAPREELKNNMDTIMKIVSKHVKLKSKLGHDGKKTGYHSYYYTPSLSSNQPDGALIYKTKLNEITTAKSFENLENDKDLPFDFSRGNRRLLSTELDSSSIYENKNTLAYHRGNTEPNGSRNSIDQFVKKLYMNQTSQSPDDAAALHNYIEGVTQMNIKIYSTAGPSYDLSTLVSEPQQTIIEQSLATTEPVEVGKLPMEFFNLDTEQPDSDVTFHKSMINIDTSDSLIGKILLTVKDPQFGLQNFNLIFNVPLEMKDNFNYPNFVNQFEVYNNSRVDPQGSDMDSIPDHDSEELDPNAKIKKASKHKRETKVNSILSNSTETNNKEYNIKRDSNATENLFKPAVDTFNSTNTIVSLAPAVTLKAVRNDRPAAAISILKAGDGANSTAGDNMTLSEFLGTMADWFKTLEFGKQDTPTEGSTGSALSNMMLLLNSEITNQRNNVSSTDSAYPLYDSDMIENIGHRSRVLLSIEDNDITEGNHFVSSTNATKLTAASSTTEGNVLNRSPSTTPTTDLRSNITTTKNNSDNVTFYTIRKDNKTKGIVKRNADESNLVFWDDIYDDEYGVQRDKFDNYMKDKTDDAVKNRNFEKEKDFIKRSGKWVQNKIRKFAKNLKINPHSNDVTSAHSSMKTNDRVLRSIWYNNKNNGSRLHAVKLVFALMKYSFAAMRDTYQTDSLLERHKGEEMSNTILYHEKFDEASVEMEDHTRGYYRGNDKVGRAETPDRNVVIEEDYPDVDQKSLFAALSANMKEVCKKAARAVQQTRNMDSGPDNPKRSEEGTEESKQGSIANALMQQLVRLLTDLVDYQVQQKTCAKLPVELQSFLEWLTYSNEESEEAVKQSQLPLKEMNREDVELIDDLSDHEEGEQNSFDLLTEQDKSDFSDEMQLTEKGAQYTIPDDITSYQDSLHSVQDLLHQYNDMTEDEKNKLLGVKSYLQKQQAFLNQQLSAYELYTFFEKGNMERNKRGFHTMKQRPRNHRQRRTHKFIRKFTKKHTRTTAGYHNAAQKDMAMKRKTLANKEILQSVPDKNVYQKITKRNLKDVYFKAVEEAKKFSSAKIIHKKEGSDRFETSTAMGHM